MGQQSSIRTVISAEYKDILQSNAEIHGALTGLVEQMKRMNGTVREHSKYIEDINQWRTAHDAVQKALCEMEKTEKQRKTSIRRNNIALASLIILTVLNLLSNFVL